MNPTDATAPMAGDAPRGGLRAPAAVLSAYVDAARGVEIDPYAQLRRLRLPTREFDEQHVTVALDDLLALVERTAEQARRPDFALRLASAIDLAAFGPVVLLASVQPTVRDALGVLGDHVAGAGYPWRAMLVEAGETATLRLALDGPDRRCASASDLALALAVRFLQTLLGPRWRPQRTEFARAAPDDVAPYEACFGAVAFGRREDAISFPAAVLARRCPLGNAALARLVEQRLGLCALAANEDFVDRVRGLIETLLSRGLCSAEQVAEHLGVDRRTVHRRLAERGLSFRALELAVRRGIVEAELGDPRRSVAAVARHVGISSLSSFSRWFRQTYGQSPRAFRKALLEQSVDARSDAARFCR